MMRMRRIAVSGLLLAAATLSGVQAVSAVQTRSSDTVEYRVRPGETLWEIAGRVAPDADRRRTIHYLGQINELGPGGLQAGQLIRVPAPR